MSHFLIYLKLPLYKAEWIRHHLGDPVVFPANSPQNAIIRTYLQRLPAGVMPLKPEEGSVAIAIPDSKAKPPEYWNYLGPRGQEAVKESIDDLFRRCLWNDISQIDTEDCPVGLNKRIAAWCEMHGIGLDRVETVRQCYARMWKAFSNAGINLRKSSRKKELQ